MSQGLFFVRGKGGYRSLKISLTFSHLPNYFSIWHILVLSTEPGYSAETTLSEKLVLFDHFCSLEWYHIYGSNCFLLWYFQKARCFWEQYLQKKPHMLNLLLQKEIKVTFWLWVLTLTLHRKLPLFKTHLPILLALKGNLRKNMSDLLKRKATEPWINLVLQIKLPTAQYTPTAVAPTYVIQHMCVPQRSFGMLSFFG